MSVTPDNCPICGTKHVWIRGKFPKTAQRQICPTCAYERLEQINEISSSGYLIAYSNVSNTRPDINSTNLNE